MAAPRPTKKVAVLDDDESFRDYLSTLLGRHGYAVHAFSTPGALLDFLGRGRPDLVVLDLQLPGFSGWELVRAVRGLEGFKSVPLVLVSGAHKKAAELVKGLELGADEYFTKPLSGEVFLARLEALLRRRGWTGESEEEGVLRFGSLTLSMSQRLAWLGRKELDLTKLEFDLLLYLCRNPDKVHTRGVLLERVWGQAGGGPRAVDKYVEYLRRKLGREGERLETVVGVGYILRTAQE